MSTTTPKRKAGRPTKSEPATPLGHQLRLLRGDLTYAQAGARIDAAETTWRNWECGENEMHLSTLREIAAAWRVAPWELLAAAAGLSISDGLLAVVQAWPMLGRERRATILHIVDGREPRKTLRPAHGRAACARKRTK